MVFPHILLYINNNNWTDPFSYKSNAFLESSQKFSLHHIDFSDFFFPDATPIQSLLCTTFFFTVDLCRFFNFGQQEGVEDLYHSTFNKN